MPKVGFNGYFIQFREAHTFFDRWYSHEANPYLEGEHITVDEARELHRRSRSPRSRSADLLYHAVGHGWTCEPFGISGLGWEAAEERTAGRDVSSIWPRSTASASSGAASR